MTSKRILLIHDDRLLLRFYQGKLEEHGFAVETVRDLELGRKALVDRKPDAVLLDHVFLAGNACDFIRAARADSATTQVPILIFPSALTQAANECVRAGATGVIPFRSNSLVAMIRGIQTTFGIPPIGEPANGSRFQPGGHWIQSILANAVESVNQMRHCLPGVSETPPELPALHEFWNLAHSFTQKVSLLRGAPLAILSRALDLLLHELNESPEDLNPSTIRTLGQALDFLSTVIKCGRVGHLTDPAFSRLVVLDDEESARRFIRAALKLVGLKGDCAESPSLAAEMLEGEKADLIFLDVGLPEMNGFDLCAKIRTFEKHKSTPIVFLTGMPSFQNKAKASLSGGNDFVGKPFNLPELGLKALIWLFRGQLGMLSCERAEGSENISLAAIPGMTLMR